MTIKYNYEWGGYQAQQIVKGELLTIIAPTPFDALKACLERAYKLNNK